VRDACAAISRRSLGELYASADRRRTAAFQIYGSAINLGAFIAPLVTGALGQAYGWHAGFRVCRLRHAVRPRRLSFRPARSPARDGTHASRSAAAAGSGRSPACVLPVAIIPVAALFWVAQSQVWNTYNLWVRDHIVLRYGGWTMPVPWLQSLDGLAPFLCLPPLLLFWRWQARRGTEPDELTKLAIGCFLFAASTLWLGGSAIRGGAGRARAVAVGRGVPFRLEYRLALFFTHGHRALFPRGTEIGECDDGGQSIIFRFSSAASSAGGWAVSTKRFRPGAFWSLHAALVGLGGVAMLVLGVWMRRALGPT
jgi:POT family proton-dependent oligopeptide transporter